MKQSTKNALIVGTYGTGILAPIIFALWKNHKDKKRAKELEEALREARQQYLAGIDIEKEILDVTAYNDLLPDDELKSKAMKVLKSKKYVFENAKDLVSLAEAHIDLKKTFDHFKDKKAASLFVTTAYDDMMLEIEKKAAMEREIKEAAIRAEDSANKARMVSAVTSALERAITSPKYVNVNSAVKDVLDVIK